MNADNDRFMRLPEVMRVTGMCRSTIYAKMADGAFPAQVKLSINCVAWRGSDISGWMENPMAWAHAA
ncbi:AlpA family phage regulatory protein (plasmid) [Sphingomonas paeninsulae]|uniref:AlpA family phage regulatory protein n=1 Tax=Sphingomonas paeninsulae TaxID=2319844 RepID=A0A494TE42_SPHPE|nr:AlpA family phage regulatory protein [Sphingomonas paeninsulae]AYJ85323.1 AlpA family phage regulatory protein [Sphingomonas paeninsulae]